MFVRVHTLSLSGAILFAVPLHISLTKSPYRCAICPFMPRGFVLKSYKTIVNPYSAKFLKIHLRVEIEWVDLWQLLQRKTLAGGHGGSSASSYLADPKSPIPSHCAVIILFKGVPVHQLAL